jgi:hypothetical protein
MFNIQDVQLNVNFVVGVQYGVLINNGSLPAGIWYEEIEQQRTNVHTEESQ